MRRRVALLRRLPRLWWRGGDVWLPVPEDQRAAYPTLADDLAFLDEHLGPAFVELDRVAQREQNRFRRQQLSILMGGAVTTVLGGVQAAFASAAWPGFLLAVTGAAVGSLSFVSRNRNSRGRYLGARLRAEQLRSLYFAYLGRLDAYAHEQTRKRELVAAVARIRHDAGEPTGTGSEPG